MTITLSTEHFLGVIEAVTRYQRKAVETILRRHAQGWTFHVEYPTGKRAVIITAPDGHSWAVQRSVDGNWYVCPEAMQPTFERAWGSALREAWAQRLISSADTIFTEE